MSREVNIFGNSKHKFYIKCLSFYLFICNILWLSLWSHFCCKDVDTMRHVRIIHHFFFFLFHRIISPQNWISTFGCGRHIICCCFVFRGIIRLYTSRNGLFVLFQEINVFFEIKNVLHVFSNILYYVLDTIESIEWVDVYITKSLITAIIVLILLYSRKIRRSC